MGISIILGSARCVWEDYEKVKHLPHDLMAINDIGMHVPNIRHWYSNDAGMLRNWFKARRPEYNKDIKLHSCQKLFPDEITHHELSGGNSGVNAVCVAQKYYDKIFVCGVPLDNSGHYFDPPWIKSNYHNDAELDEWSRRVLDFHNVISLSGNTKEILEEKYGLSSY